LIPIAVLSNLFFYFKLFFILYQSALQKNKMNLFLNFFFNKQFCVEVTDEVVAEVGVEVAAEVCAEGFEGLDLMEVAGEEVYEKFGEVSVDGELVGIEVEAKFEEELAQKLV
jgi:hypothetical protein